jgi:hypothetical protein
MTLGSEQMKHGNASDVTRAKEAVLPRQMMRSVLNEVMVEK